ncbi:MAG: hypothetical protein ACI841_002537 [Planctomycetota bacterium]|jgi:hypothetical protein
MSQEPDKPFNEARLQDAEYRDRLMRKLNCLIAVLEVANAKVKKSLSGPEPDVDRLEKIQTNLKSTLEVCRRARKALERREALPEGLPDTLTEVARRSKQARTGSRSTYLPQGSEIEMSSKEEKSRFTSMGKILPQEIQSCDLDALINKL